MTLSANSIDYTKIENRNDRDDFRYTKIREFPFTVQTEDKHGSALALYGFTNEKDARRALDYIAQRTSNFNGYVTESMCV